MTFTMRPDIWLHLSLNVFSFKAPLLSRAGPYMFQNCTFTLMRAILVPSSQGGDHDSHSRAVPSLSQ